MCCDRRRVFAGMGNSSFVVGVSAGMRTYALREKLAAINNSGTRNELACVANCLHCSFLLTCTNNEATRITAHTGCRMYHRSVSHTAFARINVSNSDAGMNVPPFNRFAYFCAYADCASPTAGHRADTSPGEVGVGSRGSGSRQRKRMVRLEVRLASRKVP